MRKIVSLSGGRTSAYLAHLMKDHDPEFIFCDTGVEDQETYNFIREIVKNWGINLTCLRVEINPELGKGNGYKIIGIDDIGPDLKPWADMVKKYGDPAINFPFCTDRMKTEPCAKYLKDRYGDQYELILGIRIDEPSRLLSRDIYKQALKSEIDANSISSIFTDFYKEDIPVNVNNDLSRAIIGRIDKIKAKNLNYMANYSDFEKTDVLNWWKKQPFDLKIDEHLGNCVFCIKKGANKLAIAAKDRPQSAIDFIEITEGEKVRIEGRKVQDKAMYRGRKKLSDILEEWDEVDRDAIFNNLRSTKAFNTESCSESCEAFNLEFEF